ncbi:MAG: hypothetical protein AABY22_11130, partial [Nanoarchaeota archaeon]
PPSYNTRLAGRNVTDAVSGNYLLSKTELRKEDAQQILFRAGIIANFNKKMIPGIEVFSQTLPKDLSVSSRENLDNPIVIKNGEVVKGVVDENTFGVEKGELIKDIDRKYGRDQTMEIISKVFTLGTNYLYNRGLTISLGDLDIGERVNKISEDTIKEAEEKVKKIIESYEERTLESLPGKTLEESREIKILQTLNEVRTRLGTIVKKEFPEDNPVSYMIISGAGGNVINITQMACCVGQQSLWARRIEFGYSNRTLSFFKEKDLSPKAHGFIYSSFIKGLKPHEFFFGAITGRDSLMDTALRTPKSGYLYRRLANALQDLRSEYDGTVRDGGGNIIEFLYGDDGIDPAKLHLKESVSPGEGVGIVTAQSFGEPSTQMALNVFHFAGVQEMQITLGLPRLIEIFDARKKPSSPKMEIYLDKDHNNEKDAKIIAEKIKEFSLKEISSEISINFIDKKIEIKLNPSALRQVHLSAKSIADILKEKEFNVKERENSIILHASELSFKELYKLKEKLKKTIVSGVKGIVQVLIVKRER